MTVLAKIAVLLALASNTVFSFFRPRQATAVYVVLAFIAPHLRIGGTAVPYEILAFLPVGLIVFYRERFRIRPQIEYGLWALYFVLAFAATLLSTAEYGSEVRWVAVFGWGRAFFLLLLTGTVFKRQDILWVLSAVIGVNSIFSVGQLFLPGILDVTHALYSQESMTVLDRYLEQGVIPRAVGTMGTPVDLGALALITFGITYERVLRLGSRHSLVFVLVLSALVGVFSLSKTAILGIPLLLGIGFALQFGRTITQGFRILPRRVAAISTTIIVGGTAIWYLVGRLREAGLQIFYYLSFFGNPLKALESRYAADSGGLWLTMEVAMENVFTGVGFTAPKGEFLGDSTYVLALHTAGVWGILIVLSLYCLLAYRAVFYRGTTMFIPLAAIGITGLATARLFALPGVLVITYVLAREKHLDFSKTFVRK